MSDKSSDDEDLGGPRDATPEQMLHKAIERHPDKNHEDSPEVSNQKMQVPNEAHEILESQTKMVEYDHTFKGDVGSSDGVGHPSEQETPLSPEGNVHPEEGEQSEEEVASGEDPPSVAPPSQTVSRDDEVEDEDDLYQAMKATVSIPNMTINEAGEEDASVEEYGPPPQVHPIHPPGTAPPSPIEPRDYKVGGPSDEVSKTPISVPRKEDENSLASKNSDNKSEINVLESPQPVSNQHIKDTTPPVSNPILEAMEQNVLDWDTLVRLARDQSALSQHMKDLDGQRSLLHIAVASGRYSLVRDLLDMLIIGTNFNKAEALKFIEAIDPETNATALQMEDETNRIMSVSVYIKIVIHFLESSEISLDSFIAQHRRAYNLISDDSLDPRYSSLSAVDRLFCRAATEEVPADIRGAMEQKDWARLGKLFSMHFNNRDPVLSEHMRRIIIGGRSVLHVAAMYGCFPLVKQILDNLTSSEERLDSESRKKALCFIRAIDPATGLTALQMADDIIGNRSISERIKRVLRFLESSSGGTLEDFETSTILFEAYPHTQWYKELKTYVDKKGHPYGATVLSLLEENSRLILETFHGLSVMHLAMLYEDVWLSIRISRLFSCQGEGIVWGDSYHPRAVSWSTMKAAKAHGEKEFSWEIFRNTPSDLLPYYGVSISEIAQTSGLPNRMKNRLLWDPIEKVHETYGTRTYYMPKWIIDEKWKVEEWQARFEADVDFNFEVDSERKSQLRVHHACKDPLRFQEFLTSLSKDGHFKHFSTMLHDGQGRTMHHILLDHHTSDKLPGWAFFEIFSPEVSKYCIEHAQDSKGRCLKDILIGKNYIQHNIMLEPFSYHNMNFERDAANEEGYSRVLGNYYIACALWQYNIAKQPTWVAALQAYMSKLGTMELLPFVIATSTNTTMLQKFLRLELGVHLMVKDKKERTMLHYAADPTLFIVQTLLDMSEYESSMILECFSTVEDYDQFKMKASSKNNMGFNIENQDLEMEKEATIQSNVRRRATILMLLQAGSDLAQEDNDGKGPNLGPTLDANFQTWWYDLVVKDATDNKQSFNQAGNALSVVGTLVAATSYIGPLQPPMNYIEGGLVNHSKTLVDIFMVTNTLAFFLAMASVMFAVVPSLPMPRESIMSELKRARQMVLVSLCLLLVAIATIIISFSAASVVVNQYEHFFPRSNVLFGPLLIGWSICLIAIASFFIRILRLSFYENAIVHMIYRFSLRGCCMRTWKLICTRIWKFPTRIWKFCSRIWEFWTRTWDSYRALIFRDFNKIFQPINVLFPGGPDLSTVTGVFVVLCVILYTVLVFPIFLILHVLHVVILIPCKRLYVLCRAQFRRCHKPGVRVSRQS